MTTKVKAGPKTGFPKRLKKDPVAKEQSATKHPQKSNRRDTGGLAGKATSGKMKPITRPRTSKQYFSFPATQQEAWNRVTHVISKMRSDGVSLSQASREFDIAPRVVKDLAGAALRKTKSGRYVARKSDKLLRVLVVPARDGLAEVVVRDSEVASKIAEYSDAVQKYLRTGDAAGLKKFRRMKLLDEKGGRIKLVTDLEELQKLGSAGVLSFESLYRSIGQ